jgi:hypothetical protein
MDAAFKTAYVWRGVTRSSGWVFQPDLVLGVGWPHSFINAGAWANVELYSADPATDISLGEQTEWNAWVEYALWKGNFDITLGYIRYFYDEGATPTGVAVFNTGELYADLGWRFGPLQPRLSGWFDIDEVKGAYFEASATYRVPVFPLAIPSIYFGLLGGFSAGQNVSSDNPNQPGYFADDGLTHVDLWTYTQIYLPIGPVKDLYATIDLHFQVGVDAATKRSGPSPDSEAGTKFWLGLSLSWYN